MDDDSAALVLLSLIALLLCFLFLSLLPSFALVDDAADGLLIGEATGLARGGGGPPMNMEGKAGPRPPPRPIMGG